MKKIIYLLMIIPIAFASCEVEKLNNSEDLTGIDAKANKNNANAATTLIWPDDKDCTFRETDLIAGQNMVVGTVTVKVVGENYIITYDVDAGYCLTETHLSVVSKPEDDFPRTNSGNPKNGHFEFGEYLNCASDATYEVPTSRGAYIAAHAVVNCETTTLEDIAESLPKTVDFCTSDQGPLAYLNISVIDDFITGDYGAWCIDDDLPIDLNKCEDERYQNVPVYLSTETLPDVFLHPENFDKVNWLLNQDFVGNGYTYGELQFAIWTLLDDASCTDDCGLGMWDPLRAAELVRMANENRDLNGIFIPGCDDFVGIVLIPDGVQPLIIPFPIECNECEETAWAKGCGFPGNNWAMYFHYE